MENISFDSYADIYRNCTGNNYNRSMPILPWSSIEDIMVRRIDKQYTIDFDGYLAQVNVLKTDCESFYDVCIYFESTLFTERIYEFADRVQTVLEDYFDETKNISRVFIIDRYIRNVPVRDHPACFTIYIAGIKEMFIEQGYWGTVFNPKFSIRFSQVFESMVSKIGINQAIIECTRMILMSYINNIKYTLEQDKLLKEAYQEYYLKEDEENDD